MTTTRVALLSLGMTLARRGPMSVVSLAVCGLTVLGLIAIAIAMSLRAEAATPIHDVPLLASSALGWGGGFLLAFSAAVSALRRDRSEGIRDLFVTRTTSLRGYMLARVGGLAALLALVVAGGSLVVGLVSLAAATRAASIAKTLQATGAAVVYGVAFAMVIAPIAFAALGARARFGGYGYIFLIIVLPEIVTWTIGGLVPIEVTELCALPSALATLRSALSPGSVDVFRFARAAVALGVFILIALLFLRRDVVLLETETPSS